VAQVAVGAAHGLGLGAAAGGELDPRAEDAGAAFPGRELDQRVGATCAVVAQQRDGSPVMRDDDIGVAVVVEVAKGGAARR
jgi:hypothetical protein